MGRASAVETRVMLDKELERATQRLRMSSRRPEGLIFIVSRHPGLHVPEASDFLARFRRFLMVFTPRLVAFFCAALAVSGASLLGKDYRLTVAPAPVDRAAQVVVFSLP